MEELSTAERMHVAGTCEGINYCKICRLEEIIGDTITETDLINMKRGYQDGD